MVPLWGYPPRVGLVPESRQGHKEKPVRPLLAEAGHNFNLALAGGGDGVGGEEVPKTTVGPRKKSMRRLVQDEKGKTITSGPQEPSHGKNLLFRREVKRAVTQTPLTDLSDLILPSFLLYRVISENLLLLQDHSQHKVSGRLLSRGTVHSCSPAEMP